MSTESSTSDARVGSTAVGDVRRFVVGLRTSAIASDGKRYSRALQANTIHWVGVTCGGDPEVTRPFKTDNPPLGQTAPEAPPFDSTAFGNYAWPTIDWTDPSSRCHDCKSTEVFACFIFGPSREKDPWPDNIDALA